jgi:NADPH-dependent 2,4-dienoyl-CoA reductase/sulfur reductase-like enzyme/Fe-S-cluster-containing hydrogenase component 2
MNFRIEKHPILPTSQRRKISFKWNGKSCKAFDGEVITSALFASGVRVFGTHESDGAPQGIFCANGQCSQCMVIADGAPVKGCMARVRDGMDIRSCDGFPALDLNVRRPEFSDITEKETGVLIIGGGPSGLSAAAELGVLDIPTLLVDDKDSLGGKLTLQTHQFFGSMDACYAGTRGIDIAKILEREASKYKSVEIWRSTTAVGVYYDKKVGLLRENEYILANPRAILVAAGAREKALAFPGCDLPGVYGAGAFQTLVNRDLVRAAKRIFIVGGGNVGLIAAYHALQAGIEVAGLVEALPKCGGYKVHEDKIKRLGVPVWTSHTVLRAEGKETLERVTIAAVDKNFKPISGAERAFDVDTLLIAVGLSPVNELYLKARDYGIMALAAGDAEEIAEASAAMFSGKIAGCEIARRLGVKVEIPAEWKTTMEVLRSKPGKTVPFVAKPEGGAKSYPVFRCQQEIPCNPCTQVCPKKAISIPDGSIMGLPVFEGECIKCGKCALICPGLAAVIVIENDPAKKTAQIMTAYELPDDSLAEGGSITTVDSDGNLVGMGRVVKIKLTKSQDKRALVTIEVPFADRLKIAGFRMQEEIPYAAAPAGSAGEDPIICRCERVRKSAIAAEIRGGVRDMNQLKAHLKCGLGACGGRTCTELILRIFREEGVDSSDVTLPTKRPLETEIPLEIFAGVKKTH